MRNHVAVLVTNQHLNRPFATRLLYNVLTITTHYSDVELCNTP